MQTKQIYFADPHRPLNLIITKIPMDIPKPGIHPMMIGEATMAAVTICKVVVLAAKDFKPKGYLSSYEYVIVVFQRMWLEAQPPPLEFLI